MNPRLSCWGLSYSLLNSREHMYKLRSCFWVSVSEPETQAPHSRAGTVNISGPQQGCTFYRIPHVTSEPTPNKVMWIKRGVHHTEAGGSMAQEPLLRRVWPFVDLKLPVSPGLRFLTPEMLLCPGDDTGDHMAQKFLDTCPRSSPTMSVSAEQLVKGVRTPGPQPLTFLYPDCILASGRATDNHICVVFSHLTTLLNPNGFLSLTTGGHFLRG